MFSFSFEESGLDNETGEGGEKGRNGGGEDREGIKMSHDARRWLVVGPISVDSQPTWRKRNAHTVPRCFLFRLLRIRRSHPQIPVCLAYYFYFKNSLTSLDGEAVFNNTMG